MILAIDPSTKACGWAVVGAYPLAADLRPGRSALPPVEASGVWHPSAAKAGPPRLVQLARHVVGLLAAYAVTDVVIEVDDPGPRFYRDKAGGRKPVSPQTYRSYGEAVGAVVGAAVAAVGADRVHLVTVNQWKGTRTKAETWPMAVALLGREPADHNEADAVCLAVSWLDGLPAGQPRPGKRGGGFISNQYRRAVEGAIRR